MVANSHLQAAVAGTADALLYSLGVIIGGLTGIAWTVMLLAPGPSINTSCSISGSAVTREIVPQSHEQDQRRSFPLCPSNRFATRRPNLTPERSIAFTIRIYHGFRSGALTDAPAFG